MPELSSRRQPSSTAVHAPVSRTLFTLFLILAFIASLMFATSAQAAPVVPVDDRVKVDFSAFDFAPGEQTWITHATVKNISTAAILDPIQLVMTGIDRKKVELTNADGLTDDGQPYVLVPLSGGELSPGDSSGVAELRFARVEISDPDHDNGKGNDNFMGGKGKGKSKKADPGPKGHPKIDFDYAVLGGSKVAPKAPFSFPYALVPDSGSVDVVFSIRVLTEDASIGNVLLRNLDSGDETLTNDDGSDGDQVADDAIYGATVSVNTDVLTGGQCLPYVAVTLVDGIETISPVYMLCATSFPPRIADSNDDPANIITLPGENIVYADELLIIFENGTTEAAISKTVSGFNGEVIGTILPINQYQVRLSPALTADEMENLINRLNKRKEIVIAAPNGIVETSATANDTEYVNQHGLQAIHSDDGWDTGATGSGVTVIVLDTGVDASHADFVPSQVLPGGDNTDADGHGTQMAGIIAAATDNMIGVAGIARDAQIRSKNVDVISDGSSMSDADVNQAFIDTAAIAAQVINASINRISPAGAVPGLCQSINTAINSGKVVVNSAGNNNSDGAYWPGQCNSVSSDSVRIDILGYPASDKIVNKARFIVVSATNCNLDECPTDSRLGTSNFGSWVDVAAPGNSVPTLQSGGGTTNVSNTSPAAAMISAAAANLSSCGVALNSIEPTLQAGTLVQISYGGTAPGNTPRIDMVEALGSLNTAPTGLLLNGGTSAAVNENTNTAGGFAVGTLTTSDTTTCDTHTYAITGGADAASFSIAGDQLELDDGNLNFEAKASYTVDVQSTDFYGSSTGSQTFTVNVADLDEPPSVIGATFSIDENEPNGTNVGTVSASDEDAGFSPAYAITAGNTGGTFAINASTGQITVANSGTLDFETNPTFSLTVEVTDNGDAPPLSNTATVTVNLNDVPDGPAFTTYSVRANYVADLGGTAPLTQNFNSFSHMDNLAGVNILPGVTVTTNLTQVIAWDGNSDSDVELFILSRSDTTDDAFYDINFASTYNAVGFDIDAFNPATPGPGVMEVHFQDGSSTSVDIFPTNATESDPVFFGVIANQPITRIRWTEGPEVGGGPGNEETSLDEFAIANLP